MKKLIEFRVNMRDMGQVKMASAAREAAEGMASVFSKSGFKTRVGGTDSFGLTPLTVTVDNVRFPVQISGQFFPKSANFSIQFQSSLMSDRGGTSRIVLDHVRKAMSSATSKFNSFGKSKFSTAGPEKWPQIWVDIEDSQKDNISKGIPSAAKAVASYITKELHSK